MVNMRDIGQNCVVIHSEQGNSFVKKDQLQLCLHTCPSGIYNNMSKMADNVLETEKVALTKVSQLKVKS